MSLYLAQNQRPKGHLFVRDAIATQKTEISHLAAFPSLSQIYLNFCEFPEWIPIVLQIHHYFPFGAYGLIIICM
jgi:hypothetical protein